MTFEEAIALQPAWVGLWLNWLFFGAFILPLALLIWRQTRLMAVITVAASVLAGAAIYALYGKFGYVKLLGVPHVVIWTPLVIWLVSKLRDVELPIWARRVIGVVVATMVISLLFDYVDLVRYILGEREAMAGTLPSGG